jgi:hydroxyethylthiazole kinase-like uncharacterized protein yjeF
MILVTAGQMQRMDHKTINDFGIPGRVLMENAGQGAFDMLVRKFAPLEGKKVAIFIGRGNNGGDGFVIGRYLMEKGIQTTFYLLTTQDKLAGDAKANYILARKLGKKHPGSKLIEIPDTDTLDLHKAEILLHDLFVDAIFGIGLNSHVRGFFKDVIDLLNESKKEIFSIDISSGLHADTGAVCGVAIKASATACFGFAKAGQILYPGNQHTGDLEVIDIGIPGFIAQDENPNLFLLENKDITPLFAPRRFQSHKGSFGHLLMVAGSPGKTGAAALCANAAMRSGTGLVTLGIAQSLNPCLESQVIEPMTVPLPETAKGCLCDTSLAPIKKLLQDKQALALGPGLGIEKETRTLVKKLIQDTSIPLVIDADGLNCIVGFLDILKSRKAPTILTPHPGEMARLCQKTTQEIQTDRIGIATWFAREYQVVLVLKGAQTLVCCPDGRTFINPGGNPGMASGGMGDVLTGMIAGFAAQGFSIEDAALSGVFIHGLCGDILAEQTRFGFLASDMVHAIPKTIHEHLL